MRLSQTHTLQQNHRRGDDTFEFDSLSVLIAFGKLPDRERDILFSRVVFGESLQVLADLHGLTRERIRQLADQATARFERALDAELSRG